MIKVKRQGQDNKKIIRNLINITGTELPYKEGLVAIEQIMGIRKQNLTSTIEAFKEKILIRKIIFKDYTQTSIIKQDI